jgi:ankyrin repeat protein
MKLLILFFILVNSLFASELLFKAIDENNLVDVKNLVEIDKVDVNSMNIQGETALTYSIIKDKYLITKYLLEKNADPNLSNERKQSPILVNLFYAKKANNFLLGHFKSLIEYGAEIHNCGDYGDSVLAEAAGYNYKGHHEMVKILLEHEVDVNKICKRESPLSNATRSGNIRVVEMLLSKGADPNQKVLFNISPLSNAVRLFKNNFKMIDMLLEAGADINLKGFDGWTPLMDAAYENVELKTINVFRYLLQKGADKKIKNDEGKTVTAMLKDIAYGVLTGYSSKEKEIAKEKLKLLRTIK